jgi:predicted N-acetyltransferase YhbS
VLEVGDATPEDHAGILALTLEAFGEEDEPLVRARLEGPDAGLARWTVVRDQGRVISTCTLLPFRLRLDGLDVPAGQIEFVTTDPAYRRHGLIRRQFDVHHRRSAEAGHVVQLILGIPYVYRRFGYGYAVDYPRLFTVARDRLRPDPTVEIVTATVEDLAVLDAAALGRGRVAQGVAIDHRAAIERQVWTSHTADPPGTGSERLFIARRGGDVVGLSALTVRQDEKRIYHVPTLLADRAVSDTIVAHAGRQAPDFELLVHDTACSAWSGHLAAAGTPLPPEMGIYARIADPTAFLEAVRPVLSARLRASPLADAEGSVTISLYGDGVRLDYAGGEVTAVTRVPGDEDPFGDLGCGGAPARFPARALGRWGARGLEERVDDVSLGRHGEALGILFPRRPADIVAGF